MKKDTSCLEKLIGIQTECETLNSESGYYIHNIAGINLQFGNNVADVEYTGGLAFLKEQRRFAASLLWDEFKKFAFPLMRQQTTLEHTEFCSFKQGDFMAAGTGERGVKFTKYNRGNKYGGIVIPSVKIYSNTTQLVTLKLKDGTLPVVSYANIQLTAGTITTVLLNYTATFEEVYIYFDQNGISVGNADCSSGCSSCGSSPKSFSSYGTYIGYNGAVETSGTNFGIMPTVNIECDLNKILCAYSDNLALPLLYKLGSVLYEKLKFSKRLNRYTLYDSKTVEQQVGYFDELYRQQMAIEIQSIFHSLKKENNECLQCNSSSYGYTVG